MFYSFCPDGCWYVSPGTCKTASSPPPHAVFWHLSVTSCSVISRKGKVTTFILREQILPWWGATSNVTTAQENDMSLDGLGDMKVTAHMLQLFHLPSRPKWTLAAHTWPRILNCFFSPPRSKTPNIMITCETRDQHVPGRVPGICRFEGKLH